MKLEINRLYQTTNARFFYFGTNEKSLSNGQIFFVYNICKPDSSHGGIKLEILHKDGLAHLWYYKDYANKGYFKKL